MQRRAWLIAAAVGFLLVTGSPSQDPAPQPPKEEKEYAKVELKGQLAVGSPDRPEPAGPRLFVGYETYALDLSQQKDLQGEALRKLDGETIIVTGTLSFDRVGSAKVPRVLVSSLRLVKGQ